MMNLVRLLSPSSFFAEKTSKALASGRWWPQPERRFSSSISMEIESSSTTSGESAVSRLPTAEELDLKRENALPIFAPRRGNGKLTYKLVPGRKGELMAGYTLFVDSIRKCELNWHPYDTMTKAEKTVYISHIKAVEARKLEYTDPLDKSVHKTVSALIYAEKCCGEGCRHCPYELENCDSETKKHLIYNGVYYL